MNWAAAADFVVYMMAALLGLSVLVLSVGGIIYLADEKNPAWSLLFIPLILVVSGLVVGLVV